MRQLLVPAALAAACLAVPANAQDAPAETGLADMAERMADPAMQQQTAMMLRAMTEILLDMPVAPMVEAMAEMAGKDPETVDPDMTLRKYAPQAERVPEAVERHAPQVMRGMGAMAGALDKMAPQMRDMARRMEQALPPAE